MNKSYQIIIKTTLSYEELVANILWENGANGVSIEDTVTVLDSIKDKRNWDYLDDNLIKKLDNEDDNDTCISGFFDCDCVINVENSLLELSMRLGIDKSSFVLELRVVDNNEWLDYHKKYFAPLHFNSCIIAPEWTLLQDIDNDKKLPIVKLLHTSAFGTGQHESTAMCIQLLELCEVDDYKVVADVGCGTGILGLVANALGYKQIDFFDYDNQAVAVASNNCKLNNMSSINVKQNSLLNGVIKQYDIILCNLTADLLIELVKDIDKNLKPNSKIIASGIINARAEEVELAFLNIGLKVAKRLVHGEWTAFLLKVKL